MRVCLAGNPNCGKTTLFNALTGSHQKVGNWAGVTVDKRSGYYRFENEVVTVVDLPGTYSLTVTSDKQALDEQIANTYLAEGNYDCVINVLDASNLARNLYLTLQLLEMEVPLILAVNMTDIAKKRGLQLNLARLAEVTGCQVVPLVSRKGIGITQLQKTIRQAKTKLPITKAPVYAGTLAALLSIFSTDPALAALPYWQKLRILEGDHWLSLQLPERYQAFVTQAQGQGVEEADIVVADARFQLAHAFAEAACQEGKAARQFFSERLDHVVLNRWLGIPIFLLVIYLMFEFAITLGGAFQPIFDGGSQALFIDGMMYLGHVLQLPVWLTAVLAQGIGLGINTVITFIPQIGGMFLFLCFVESSGYMARAAFVMDRLMQTIGLPGKSFVPLIVGFGCNVPAILATRTIESRRDRLLTIMMAPFMSCGARLAIFAVFAGAFFPQGGALVVFILYLTGIAAALMTGLLMKKTLLRGQPTPYIMELPPYHLPNARNLLLDTWHRLKGFLFRAGKIIVPICVLVGTLNAMDWSGHIRPQGSPHSILSSAGKMLTPVFAPMGITQENWPATVGLLTGTLAKEVVVGALNTLYTQNQPTAPFDPASYHLWGAVKTAFADSYQNLRHLRAASFANPFSANEAKSNMSQTAIGNMVTAFGSPLSAFAYLLFVLLYVPCVSTIGAATREAGRRWAWLSVAWSLLLAYALAVIVYQCFQFATAPWLAGTWVATMLGLLLFWVYLMRYFARHDSWLKQPILSKTKGACFGCSGCPSKLCGKVQIPAQKE